jgi:lactoylglutathione lyase
MDIWRNPVFPFHNFIRLHTRAPERGNMIRQLAHLNFVTNDLSRIIDFYVSKLGMRVSFTLNNDQGEPFGYYFGCGNTSFLEFFDQAMAARVWGGNVEQLTPGTRYRHFCLEVIGLDEYCKALREKGVDVTAISMGMDHSRQAWVTDPDGNQIELIEYGPSSLQLTGG